MRSGGKVVTCMFRQFSRKFGRGGTDCGRGHVVHDVGKIRAVGAALVAAGMVLSGCGLVGGEGTSTTTSSAAETQSNPWDLPVEQRPALFDPCAEVPIGAVEEGAGAQVIEDPELMVRRPAELMACGWSNDEIIFNIVSTWKTRESFLSDEQFVITEYEMEARPGYRALSKADVAERSCQQLFLTSLGAVFISIDLVHGLSAFEGQNFANPCDVLEDAIGPLMSHLPEGDF